MDHRRLFFVQPPGNPSRRPLESDHYRSSSNNRYIYLQLLLPQWSLSNGPWSPAVRAGGILRRRGVGVQRRGSGWLCIKIGPALPVCPFPVPRAGLWPRLPARPFVPFPGVPEPFLALRSLGGPACRSARAGARSGGTWGLVLSPRTTTTRQSGASPLGNMQEVHPSRSALRYGVPASVFWLPIPSCDRWRRLLFPLIGFTVFPLGAVESRFSPTPTSTPASDPLSNATWN